MCIVKVQNNSMASELNNIALMNILFCILLLINKNKKITTKSCLIYKVMHII